MPAPAITEPPSSPISRKLTTVAQSASEAASEIQRFELVAKLSNEDFLKTYVSVTGAGSGDLDWSKEQLALIKKIKKTEGQQEKALYTKQAPLLRLLNSISKQVLRSLNNQSAPALVFLTCHDKHIPNPFTRNAGLSPDIIVIKGDRGKLEQLSKSKGQADFACPTPTWHGLVAVGEAKTNKNSSDPYQVTNYLRNHLQLRPDRNAVLGFTVKPSGYRFFYHDACVVHSSHRFDWVFEPLYSFIRQLYNDPFRDPTMALLQTGNVTPTWVTKIDDNLFVSRSVRPDPGPGQRRFIAVAALESKSTNTFVFIKDFWRDTRRRFFEGSLYEKAHEGDHLPGLMTAEWHGYVLGLDGKIIGTTFLMPKPMVNPRYKMRIATRDVGQPLHRVASLHQFLCVMYDVCVVLRNLYRKADILHRDISDNNIMIAPDDKAFFERCATGYNQVKYINQVLSGKESTPPRPACLLVDLGNGANLKEAETDPALLAQRTGTPKFIARSVSLGKALPWDSNSTAMRSMPQLAGRARELYESQYGKQHYISITQSVQPKQESAENPNLKFTHRLFHDAESVFWVIAWSLARSVKPGSREDVCSQEFERFISTMNSHQPANNPDGRESVTPRDESEWVNILHEDLAGMAPMLSKMAWYIFPEWGLRTGEVDEEHVHEALMRLLLTEIVRLEDEGDVDLEIGIRWFPKKAMKGLNASQRTSSSTGLLEVPESTNLPPPNSKKRDVSQIGDGIVEAPPRRQSPRFLELNLEQDVGGVPEAGSLQSLFQMAREISWGDADCALQPFLVKSGEGEASRQPDLIAPL